MSGFTPPFWITAAGSFVSSWRGSFLFGVLFLLNKAGVRKKKKALKIVIYRQGKPEKREAVPIFPLAAITPNSEMLVVGSCWRGGVFWGCEYQ